MTISHLALLSLCLTLPAWCIMAYLTLQLALDYFTVPPMLPLCVAIDRRFYGEVQIAIKSFGVGVLQYRTGIGYPVSCVETPFDRHLYG